MNNEIGRKLTSLTLMTIMFAGGLTIAAPTMFPATDAETSGMLTVSTTTLQGGAILEIVVDDPNKSAIDTEQSPPSVDVNGSVLPTMVQATNGKWYAYIADKSQVAANEGISAIGWDYGNAACTLGLGGAGTATTLGTAAATGITPYVELSHGAAATYTVATATQCLASVASTAAPANVKGAPLDVNKLTGQERDEINMLQNIPQPNSNSGISSGNQGNAGMTANTTDGSFSSWPLIQTWELDATSTICYLGECIGVDRSTTDSLIGITVNKTAVTDNDHIILEITDPGLNLDPTFPDEWTFGVTETSGSETTTWRGNMTDTYGGNTALTRANIKTAGFGDGGYLSVTQSETTLANPTSAVVTVYETGPNTGVFTTLMSNDTSDLVTGAHNVASGDEIVTISYAGNSVNLVVAYTDMSMTLDAGDNWAPGETAALTIVDPDANKMSTSAETLSTSNESSNMPAITMGSPYWCDDKAVVAIAQDATDDAAGSAITSTHKEVEEDSKRCQVTIAAGDEGTAAVITYVNTTLGSATGLALGQWEDGGSVVIGWDVTEFADMLELSASITEVAVYVSTNYTSNTGAYTQGGSIGPGFITLTEGNVSKSGTQVLADENNGSINGGSLVKANAPTVSVKITTSAAASIVADTYGMSIDVCNFDQDSSSLEHDCIYRIEAEETGADTGVFEGSVTYANMNAVSAKKNGSYSGGDTAIDQSGITQNGKDVYVLMHSGASGSDSPKVEYNDTNSVGTYTTIGASQSTNNYTGIVEWDQSSYAAGDTAVLTITDPDLNQDSGTLETYANDTSTTFKITCLNAGGVEQSCVAASAIKIVESGQNSGTFVASFAVPGNYNDDKTKDSTVGTNMKASYYDSNDVGGGSTTLTSSVAIASETGSISFDKSVYPTPWGGYGTGAASPSTMRCGDDTTGNAGNCSTVYGNVTIWVTVHDGDNTNDTLACATQKCIKLKLDGFVIATAGDQNGATDESGTAAAEIGVLSEISPGSSDYEAKFTLTEFSDDKPQRAVSGSILQAIYVDPSDAGGLSLEVYDSASLDMRNASLSLDKDTYVLGADMVVTLSDPDMNRDSATAETLHADFIEWDSAASSSRLMSNSEFGCTPSTYGETGSDTGVFQSTCTFPASVASTTVQAGESVTFTYSDRTIAGENSAGDAQEDIEATASSSNFGAIVELDKAVYDWTDRVFITVTAPDHNKDSAAIESIGTSDLPVQVSSRNGKLCTSTYTLRETGEDTGVFAGEVVLKGYTSHTLISTASNTCTGPTSGALLLAAGADGVTVSYEYSNSEVTIGSAITTWNIAEVSFGDSSVSASGSTLVRMVDGDYDLDPDVLNTKVVDLTSDSDSGGIQMTLTETDLDSGVFEGTLFFTTSGASSGSILRVSEGDSVTLEFEDTTLPSPYLSSDKLTVASTVTIGTAFPPLERAPAANARVVDAFGNSVAEVSVDQQVQIAADVANGQSKDQSFAYLVQVQDASGVTVSLSWITGSLTAGQSLSPAMSWIPTASGSYTATVFVWESVDNPTALSPTTTVDIDVV